MAAVASVLPRSWDGRRLLRFLHRMVWLAGMAMLALAFTAPVPSMPEAVTFDAVPFRAAPAAISVPAGDRAEAPAVTVAEPLHQTATVSSVTVLGITTVLLLAGAARRVMAQRAPPAV